MTDNKEEIEIDLLELANKLWLKKKFIIKVLLIGLLIGIVIAVSIPKEYTTIVTLTSGSEKTSGNMGALASLAGINLGSDSGDGVLPPELYSDVLYSTPFIQGLLDINVSDPNQNLIDITLYSYMQDKQKIAWWNYILGAPGLLIDIFSSNDNQGSVSSEKNKRFISVKDMDIIDALRNSYIINTNKKTNVTTLELTSQSPIISAYLADTLTSYLQSYIIEQRTKKAKTDLQNTEKLYDKSKTEYYLVQQNLASFIDGNRSVTSAKYMINQEKLQNEANIAYSVYNQMAQQVQMNKIKVQNDTPMFTIIQPAVESLYPSSPKKKVIVVGFLFLSFAVACGWIFGKDYVRELKKEFNTK